MGDSKFWEPVKLFMTGIDKEEQNFEEEGVSPKFEVVLKKLGIKPNQTKR